MSLKYELASEPLHISVLSILANALELVGG